VFYSLSGKHKKKDTKRRKKEKKKKEKKIGTGLACTF
jgi:hypothetical protein